MNNYILIGKIVGTHGIKGEIRIISDFEEKSQVFVPHFHLYFGKDKNEVVITSYRRHKNYDMVLLDGFDNINDVLKFKNMDVYVKRNDLKTNSVLLEDLIGLEVYNNDIVIGVVKDYIRNGSNILLEVTGDKHFYIPYVDEYILNVDLGTKKISVKNIEGLII